MTIQCCGECKSQAENRVAAIASRLAPTLDLCRTPDLCDGLVKSPKLINVFVLADINALGVRSRNEMVRINCETVWILSPGLTNHFEGMIHHHFIRSAFSSCLISDICFFLRSGCSIKRFGWEGIVFLVCHCESGGFHTLFLDFNCWKVRESHHDACSR